MIENSFVILVYYYTDKKFLDVVTSLAVGQIARSEESLGFNVIKCFILNAHHQNYTLLNGKMPELETMNLERLIVSYIYFHFFLVFSEIAG